MDKPLTLAIMSDLHCCLAGDRDSLLQVGALRKPEHNHPVQALEELIDELTLRADVLLVPGDITNKGKLEGLQQGWDHSLEIGRKLKARKVIPVLGNHDIESRARPGRDPMYIARNLRPGFPFESDADCRAFFSDGFCILDLRPDAQLVAVNTVIDHRDEKSANRGTFDVARIEKMKRALKSRLRAPLRLAMMHHHPVLHTSPYLTDADVIDTGDALVRALREAGCRLVVHGHKHVANLRYVDDVVIFAAGSFSATMNEFATSIGNMFHVAELEGVGKGSAMRGKIRTWVYGHGKGWDKSSVTHRGFPHVTGFGAGSSLDDMRRSLLSMAGSDPTRERFVEGDVLKVVAELPYMTPAQFKDLADALLEDSLEFAQYDQAGGFTLWRAFTPG